jgi:hypothetical protein
VNLEPNRWERKKISGKRGKHGEDEDEGYVVDKKNSWKNEAQGQQVWERNRRNTRGD